MSTPTADQIRQAVSEAVEEAKAHNGAASRLLPFTEAEIQFIRQVVESALARVLTGDKGPGAGPAA